jgi:hypothetical protein
MQTVDILIIIAVVVGSALLAIVLSRQFKEGQWQKVWDYSSIGSSIGRFLTVGGLFAYVVGASGLAFKLILIIGLVVLVLSSVIHYIARDKR